MGQYVRLKSALKKQPNMGNGGTFVVVVREDAGREGVHARNCKIRGTMRGRYLFPVAGRLSRMKWGK